MSLHSQIPVFEEKAATLGVTPVRDITDQYGNGAALADYDNDGDIDIYLTTDNRIADRLYQNDGHGHFTDITIGSGIIEVGSNRAALWWDYNGDHLLDLVVAGENCVNRSCTDPVHLALYRQEADGSFTETSQEANLIPATNFDNAPFYAIGGLAAADINQDQYLDLLLTVWGGGVQLFRNNTDGTFTDITAEAGLQMPEKTPWQAMFYDFNQDGRIDIYCNVDFEKNILWINQGGIFEDKAAQYGLDSDFNEMGMAISDYDNDGDLDIYATNITRHFEGVDQHNVLLRQENKNGRIQFTEIAQSEGVANSGWDWGCTFIDINNDGWQDLASTNGWNSLSWLPDASKMWLNTPAGFVDVSQKCGFNDELYAATLLSFDMDRDGDLDLLQTLQDNATTRMPMYLYENQLEKISRQGNYIVVQPRIPNANHFAIGSKLRLQTSRILTTRLISAGSSFHGQEPAEAFFGLGQNMELPEVSIQWPDHTVTIFPALELNQIHQLSYYHLIPPNNLQARFEGGQTQLTWEDNADNETGYVLHRSTDSTFQQYTTFALPANSTNYLDEVPITSGTYFYRVRATAQEVHSDNSNLAKVLIKTKTPPAFKNEIQVFPNPLLVGHHFTIKLSQAQNSELEIDLLDIQGRVVWTRRDVISAGAYELEGGDIPSPGIFILRVKNQFLEKKFKLVVAEVN